MKERNLLSRALIPPFLEMIGSSGLSQKNASYGNFWYEGKNYFYRLHLRDMLYPDPKIETDVFAHFKNELQIPVREDVILLSFQPLGNLREWKCQGILCKEWMEKLRWEVDEDPRNTLFHNQDSGKKDFNFNAKVKFRSPIDYCEDMKVVAEGEALKLVSDKKIWPIHRPGNKELF